jgi:DNA invertase Pin-like site-specific DNA recombinase
MQKTKNKTENPRPKKERWEKLRQGVNGILAEKEMTVADLARELGIGYFQVYRWLTDKDNPDTRTPSVESTLALLAWAKRNASKQTVEQILS